MPKYDVLKRLTDGFPEDYIRFALGLERFSVEVLHVEAVDKELPPASLPQRMLGYTWRLFEKYRLPVRPFLILRALPAFAPDEIG
ncbi:hypothetical protein M1N50_03605 [Dehalococcoidia bacterium]|nr:hypothetical protein [Dehalococcoidia bacterium]MCL0069689.1 hypothetical protein [Dehalococcoidia bacterium]MCL0079236.1 hypothetical protein [Dehalococcoidia bacterium]